MDYQVPISSRGQIHYTPAVPGSPSVPHSSAPRRVWVKRPSATPTTILAHQGDIIDDLKQAVVNKFPNSLARYWDAADLVVRMELQTKNSAFPVSPSFSATSPSNLAGYAKKPSNLHQFSFSAAEKQLPSASGQSALVRINLEPDQNIWAILDQYFPNGMTMNDALVIENPPTSYNDQNYDQSKAPQPPSSGTNGTSLGSSSQHTFHQPQPQYSYQGSLNSPNQALGKDASVSPDIINSKFSPFPNASAAHRRSKSNPSGSPAPDQNGSLTKTGTNSSSDGNSQVVLLLPKNFSLTNGGNNNVGKVHDHNKKRLSMDEGLISKVGSSYKTSPPPASNPLSVSLPSLDMTSLSSKSQDISNTGYTDPSSPKTIIAEGKNDPNAPVLNRASSDPHALASTTPLSKLGLAVDKDDKPPKELVKPFVPKASKQLSSINPAKSNTEKVLPSISVLVVEDNAINQAILGAFLRKHRIRYQIAKNGQEAIDKWRKGGFHLVLMDIQLPVKSGIEATKDIRHLEKVNRIGVFAEHELTNPHHRDSAVLKPEDVLDLNVFRSPVIIVALTASSNSSVDKKNALMAGCNDYLTKPVNLVWLQNKITEWGCMQALIDFDGWKVRRSTEPEPRPPSSISKKSETKGGVLLGNSLAS